MAVELTVGYWVFTFLGILATVFQVRLTFYILQKYTIKSTTWKKLEYQLILFRVLLDALNGMFSLTYYISTIPTLLYPDIFSFDVSFIIGLIASHFLEMRSFLAAVIAIERALAATIPLQFYKYRNKVSNIPIFGFILSTGIACDIVLIGFCEFRLPLTLGCTNFACATPPCYQNYSTVTRIIYASTNGFFSALLCFRLFCLSWKRTKVPVDFKRANWLSLTDGLSTLSFDLLPSLIFSLKIIDVRGLGPVIGAFRQLGRAVEAGVMVMLMKKEPVADIRNSASFRIS